PDVQKWQGQLNEMYATLGVKEGKDPLHQTNVSDPQHLQLNQVEQMVGGEALRGRTGGAVTLAVGMSFILSDAMHSINRGLDWIGGKGDSPPEEKGAVPFGGIAGILKYWYHFAIKFEALFILSAIS